MPRYYKPVWRQDTLWEIFDLTDEGQLIHKPRDRDRFRNHHKPSYVFFNKRMAGRPAGFMNGRHRYVTVGGRILPVSRVVWTMTHGFEPEGSLYFYNNDPSDTRPENMYEVLI